MLIIFIISIFLFSAHASVLEDITHSGELGFSYRQFQADNNTNNNDYQLMLEGKFTLEYETDNTKSYFSAFGRIDKEDHTRNILNVDEAYLKYLTGNWSFSLGNHIFNWSVLEVFRPVDSINARNLDANADQIERLGQPAFVITREFETSILQFISLLKTVSPMVPSVYNRNGPQLLLQNPKFVEDDYEYTDSPQMPEWIIHYLHNFETFDLDIHISRKYDTANPVVATPMTGNISPSVEDLKIIPYFLPVFQVGLAIQGSYDAFLYKIEHINYDFENYKVDFFIPPTIVGNTTREDYSLTAMGLEYSKNYKNDHAGTFFLEYQSVLGTTIEEARTINAFQRDMAIGYRHNFNDFKGHEIIIVFIHDLDHYKEQIYNLTHSFRVTEQWKLRTDLRVVEAPKPSDEPSLDNFSGLKPISESDNIRFTLTRFF